MIDLLVGSLMADGGLESALNAAITAEIQVWFISFALQVLLQGTGFLTFINVRVNVPSVVNCVGASGMCPPWFLWSFSTLFYLHHPHPSLCVSFYIIIVYKNCAHVVVTEYTIDLFFSLVGIASVLV